MSINQCDVCGGSLVEKFPAVKDPHTGESFAILTCVSCGLGHTSPTPADLDSYYGETYYGGRHGFTKQYRARRRFGLVKREIKKAKLDRKPKLFDIGCGDGTFLAIAKNDGWSVMGSELGANAARTRSLGIEVKESLDEVGSAAPFDVITMWHSLEHFRSPRRAFEQIHDLLAPNGVFVVAVPDAGGMQAGLFGQYWFHLDVPRHLFHFEQRSLTELMKSTGFRVDAWNHREIEQDLFGWLQSGLNSVFPRPNRLFQVLTGKGADVHPGEAALNVAAGVALTPVVLPLLAVSVLAHRGATLTAVARRV